MRHGEADLPALRDLDEALADEGVAGRRSLSGAPGETASDVHRGVSARAERGERVHPGQFGVGRAVGAEPEEAAVQALCDARKGLLNVGGLDPRPPDVVSSFMRGSGGL